MCKVSLVCNQAMQGMDHIRKDHSRPHIHQSKTPPFFFYVSFTVLCRQLWYLDKYRLAAVAKKVTKYFVRNLSPISWSCEYILMGRIYLPIWPILPTKLSYSSQIPRFTCREFSPSSTPPYPRPHAAWVKKPHCQAHHVPTVWSICSLD